jgi:hypothetical protein
MVEEREITDGAGEWKGELGMTLGGADMLNDFMMVVCRASVIILFRIFSNDSESSVGCSGFGVMRVDNT